MRIITVTYTDLDSVQLADYSVGQGELTHYTTDEKALTLTFREADVEGDCELEAFEELAAMEEPEEYDPDGELGVASIEVTEA
jgi:hypothetical protein